MTLDVLEGEWSVSRLAADAAVPEWAWSSTLTSVTRTAQELSILAPSDQVPDGDAVQRGFRALAVRGPLAFTMTGVLADISTALADAEVSIFVVSTYDTDVVLVPSGQLERATTALVARGHHVEA